MDNLREALQRAREEGRGDIGRTRKRQRVDPKTAGRQVSQRIYTPGQPAQAEPKPVDSKLILPHSARPHTPRGVANVRYKHTRVIELDPAALEQNRVIAGQQGDERVEAYRQLRTQVLHTFEKNNWSSLAITSPMQNAGKTLTSVNLAIALAQEVEHTVLLVDLDLSHPNVHTTLGVEVEHGLTDVISGDINIRECMFNPGVHRMTVLPGRPLIDYSSELLTSPEMRNLLQDITTRYPSRIVIFDLPPLLRNDDALKFTPFADATLMVVEAGRNTPEEVERCVHLLKNANLIGTILNKARNG